MKKALLVALALLLVVAAVASASLRSRVHRQNRVHLTM
jgi:hypothetical protein